MREDGAGHQPGAFEADGHHAIPLVFRRFERVFHGIPGGIVVQDVDAAERFDRRGDRALHVGRPPHVRTHGQRPSPGRGDRMRGVLRRRQIYIDDGDPRLGGC